MAVDNLFLDYVFFSFFLSLSVSPPPLFFSPFFFLVTILPVQAPLRIFSQPRLV